MCTGALSTYRTIVFHESTHLNCFVDNVLSLTNMELDSETVTSNVEPPVM